MKISLSYTVGDSYKAKVFDSFEDMERFIGNYMELLQTDRAYFQLDIEKEAM